MSMKPSMPKKTRFKNELLPLADLITPNIPEGEILSGIKINDEKDMQKAGKIISEKYNCSCLLKGGHKINDANDYLYENKKGIWFKGKRIKIPTEQVAPYHQPLQQILPKDIVWKIQ